MFSKVYNLRFVKSTNTKMLSSYFVKNLFKFIRTCNMQSINISMEPCGNMSITEKFDNSSDLKTFESKSKFIFIDVQGPFDFFQNNFSGINIFAYETKIPLPKLLLTNTIKFFLLFLHRNIKF